MVGDAMLVTLCYWTTFKIKKKVNNKSRSRSKAWGDVGAGEGEREEEQEGEQELEGEGWVIVPEAAALMSGARTLQSFF